MFFNKSRCWVIGLCVVMGPYLKALGAFSLDDIAALKDMPAVRFKGDSLGSSYLDFINRALSVGASTGGGQPLLFFRLNLSTATIAGNGYYNFSTFSALVGGIQAMNADLALPNMSHFSVGPFFSKSDFETLDAYSPSGLLAQTEQSQIEDDGTNFLELVNGQLNYFQEGGLGNQPTSTYQFLFYESQAHVNAHYTSGYAFASFSGLQDALFGSPPSD